MKVDMDSMYRDQAMIYEEWDPERTFFAAYTPYGIRMLDGRYTQLIMHLNENEDPQKLRVEIRDNKHLHPVIRRNLLQNLRRVFKERSST